MARDPKHSPTNSNSQAAFEPLSPKQYQGSHKRGLAADKDSEPTPLQRSQDADHSAPSEQHFATSDTRNYSGGGAVMPLDLSPRNFSPRNGPVPAQPRAQNAESLPNLNQDIGYKLKGATLMKNAKNRWKSPQISMLKNSDFTTSPRFKFTMHSITRNPSDYQAQFEN